MKKKYAVSGMSCAACQANVARAVSKIPGVKEANVSLLDKSMVVEFDGPAVDDGVIADAVSKAGYHATPFISESVRAMHQKQKLDFRSSIKNLTVTFSFLILLLLVSMVPMIVGWPAEDDQAYVLETLLLVAAQIVFLAPIVILDFHYFISGYKSLFHGNPNMDSLVAVGSTASIVYGVYSFAMIIVAFIVGDRAMAMANSMNIYFEGAGTILCFVTIGKFLESRSTSKTNAAIEDLLALMPTTANVLVHGEEIEVPTDQLKIGDIVVVRPGEIVPADGTIIEGSGDFDESALTGESVPVFKALGKEAIGATTNKTGSFKMSVTRPCSDSTLSKIVSLVREAGVSKAPIARLADKISGYFVPAVMGLSICVFVIWMTLTTIWSGSPNINLSLQLAISVLVVSCPCALGLATPVAIMIGTGKGADNGILLKSATALEELNKVDTVVFDKTGTLTKGEMSVERILFFGADEQETIADVASIEKLSEHPLSKAVTKYARERNVASKIATLFAYVPGMGVKAVVSPIHYAIGNTSLMDIEGIEWHSVGQEMSDSNKRGFTTLLVAADKKIVALISIRDELKENAALAVSLLRESGRKVVLLTGDNHLVADALAREAGIVEVFSEVLPEKKSDLIKQLRSSGRIVAMVGDGVNDAPALAAADIGIAIGAGTDVAIDSADIVLVNNDPLDVYSAIRLSHSVIRNVKENLFWAFFYNIVMIPLAAGVLYSLGVLLTPMIASIAMSASSLTVVLNALRLRNYKKPKFERGR